MHFSKKSNMLPKIKLNHSKETIKPIHFIHKPSVNTIKHPGRTNLQLLLLLLTTLSLMTATTHQFLHNLQTQTHRPWRERLLS